MNARRPKPPPLDPDDANAAYATAIRLLNYRWRARQEIVGRLGEKGFSSDAIASAMVRLDREGWIDDRRFASEFARAKVRKEGPHRIERRLRELGVERSLAQEVTRDAASGEVGRGALEQLARKKLRSIVSREGNAFAASTVGRRKLTGWLFSRGYEGEPARKVVDALLKGIPTSHDDDE